MTTADPVAARSWKERCVATGRGYLTLATEDTRAVPVRLFLTPHLLDQVENEVYHQIVTATSFPGVKLVVITADVHVGYGVPVGCAGLATIERELWPLASVKSLR